MGQRKPIIGLAGGIGAGKSTVAAEFSRQGCLVLDSDQLNHAVLRRPEVAKTLRAWWGADVYTPAGEPDRRRLAAIIFADAEQKMRLERLVHPLIAQMRSAMINAVKDDRAVNAIILDSPLLLESNLDRECDAVVFVEAGWQERLRRLQATRHWSEAELREREHWQLPVEEKRARAEFVVDNNGCPERLRPQVADILKQVISRFAA